MITKEALQRLVTESSTQLEVLKKMNVDPYNGQHKVLQELLKKYNIDTSSLVGNKPNAKLPKISNDEYFTKGKHRPGRRLKKRLIDDFGLMEECSKCGIGPEWDGHPLSLQVDHIDGDHYNNERSNLRLLCPNCHSQTDTYAGRSCRNVYYCPKCGKEKRDKNSLQCRECSSVSQKRLDVTQDELLKLREDGHSFRSIGKMYGVSDHTIKKYMRV